MFESMWAGGSYGAARDIGRALASGVPSPIHFKKPYGVHADLGTPPNKVHIPFVGQTTLQTFRIGGGKDDRPCRENDANLFRMGGKLLFPGSRFRSDGTINVD